MIYRDPDTMPPAIADELARMYKASAQRLKKLVLEPNNGMNEFSQSRAASLMSQVKSEIDRLKLHAGQWTGKALTAAVQKGLTTADAQVKAALANASPSAIENQKSKIENSLPASPHTFSLVDTHAIQNIAQATTGDLYKAADAMQAQSFRALNRMADVGITNAQVNRLISGGIIEGTPGAVIDQLAEDLRKIHGDQLTLTDKRGNPITFDTDYYARLVANAKMKEAVVVGRNDRLTAHGIDLIQVIGTHTKWPCSLLLNHVFSISGQSTKYPAFSSVSRGQLPYHLFHPNCHKSTTPWIQQLRGDAANADGRGNTAHLSEAA